MTDRVAHIDFETRSAVDLKKAGVHRYAEHPSTGVWMLRYSFGDEPVGEWRPGGEDPLDLLAHIEAGGRVVAHNAIFERTIWNTVLVRRSGLPWPKIDVEQQDCTMARGLALALPGGLDALGGALKTKIQKDKDGHKLMLQMCRPRSVQPEMRRIVCEGVNFETCDEGTVYPYADDNDGAYTCERCRGLGYIEEPTGGSVYIWWDEPAKVERLSAYCADDVRTETLVDQGVSHLSDTERRVWLLDQKINDRGVACDVTSIEIIVEIVAEAKRRADERIWWLTDGDVKKCTETAKIVAWLNTRGIPATSVAKGEIEELVVSAEIMGDETAQEVVRLRRAAARTSNDKYKSMLASVCADGRLRGALQYHGAGTGRWAGRIWQPQNFPRIDAETELSDILRIVELLSAPRSRAEMCDMIELVVGPALEWLSKCLRAMLIAGPGKKFVSGDFSNIEGRMNAWLAGERWKLEAFRAYDRGEGPDLYKVTASRILGIDVSAVTKKQRQGYGKVPELALGFQGGVKAFQTMGSNLGVYVTDDEAETIKVNWRDAHPRTVASWFERQEGAIEAVGAPGIVVPVMGGKVKYLAANGFLFCQLPSSRVLAYADPKLVWSETANGGKRRQIEYWGVDSKTKRWGPQRLYGGLQCNNDVQGSARDLLCEAAFRVEAAGYPLVLTIHDELLSEVDDAFGSADHYQQLMSELPDWAAGLPVATAAWEDKRYVK